MSTLIAEPTNPPIERTRCNHHNHFVLGNEYSGEIFIRCLDCDLWWTK